MQRNKAAFAVTPLNLFLSTTIHYRNSQTQAYRNQRNYLIQISLRYGHCHKEQTEQKHRLMTSLSLCRKGGISRRSFCILEKERERKSAKSRSHTSTKAFVPVRFILVCTFVVETTKEVRNAYYAEECYCKEHETI